jgi:hypothetical protein
MKWMIVAVVAIAMSSASASAQAPPVPRPPRLTEATIPRFDPSTVQTFSGTVLIEEGTQSRVELQVMLVRAGRQDIRTVVLGPRRLLDPALTKVAAKTAVEVTASMVTKDGQPFYLASSVKIADKQYKVRDEQGHLLSKDGKPIDWPPKKR